MNEEIKVEEIIIDENNPLEQEGVQEPIEEGVEE